jgi:hypothetical protein
MAEKLRVLVLESERGAADAAIDELARAGHEVARCHEPGAPAFPCGALADDPYCPVRDEIVDVAVTVRNRPRSQPAPHEDGVTCALEHHIPLVVAGHTVLNPFETWAAEVIDGIDGVVPASERAAAAPLERHGRRAQRALDEVLAAREIRDIAPWVDVYRRGGRLVVDVSGGTMLDHATKAMASVRMIGALREVDRDAAGIDVSFDEKEVTLG